MFYSVCFSSLLSVFMLNHFILVVYGIIKMTEQFTTLRFILNYARNLWG